MENFNIAEALRYAPEGTPLYSPLFGDVALDFVNNPNVGTAVILTTGHEFMADGRYSESSEVLLFPSKEHRDWDNWQRDLFMVGNIVVCEKSMNSDTYIITRTADGELAGCDANGYLFMIPLEFCRYAKQDEREGFAKELESNGLKWDDKSCKVERFRPISDDLLRPGHRKECADCQFNFAGVCRGTCEMKQEYSQSGIMEHPINNPDDKEPEDASSEMIGTELLKNTNKIVEKLDQIYTLLLSNNGRG